MEVTQIAANIEQSQQQQFMAFFSLLWFFNAQSPYRQETIFCTRDGNTTHPLVEYKAKKLNLNYLVKTKHFLYLRKVALLNSANLWLPEKGNNLIAYA